MGRNRKTKRRRHGLKYTRVYKAYHHMKGRCLTPTNNKYPQYGGRGITICDRWLESVVNFVEDMGHPPPGHTLDRIDTNGNYEPKNCRWATAAMQNRNRNDSKWWHVNGKVYDSIYDAAEGEGVAINTIQRWCDGYTTMSGNPIPPRSGCWSKRKY